MKRGEDNREPLSTGVDELVDELRGSQAAERGTFTMDSAAARRKLERYRLADPATFALELVQAGVMAGATRVDCHFSDGAFELRFDGAPFTKAELEGLWGALLLGDDQSPRRQVIRQLALGLHGAVGADAAGITVRSGDGAVGVDLVIQGASEVLTDSEQPTPGTQISVQTIPESEIAPGDVAKLLRERCRYADVPIELDAHRISEGLALPEAFAVEAFQQDGLRGVTGFVPDLNRSVVHLVQHGVWVGSRWIAPASAPAGCVVVLVCDNLRRDLSGEKLVEDDALANALSLASTQGEGLVSRLGDASQEDDAAELPRAWMRASQEWKPGIKQPRNLRSAPYHAPRRIKLPRIDEHARARMRWWDTLERPFFWGGLSGLVLAAAGLVWSSSLRLTMVAVAVGLLGATLMLLSLLVARPLRRIVARERRILANGRHAVALFGGHRCGVNDKGPLQVRVLEGPLADQCFRLTAPRLLYRELYKRSHQRLEIYLDEDRRWAVLPAALKASLRPGNTVERHLAFLGGAQEDSPPPFDMNLRAGGDRDRTPGKVGGKPARPGIGERILGGLVGAVAVATTGSFFILLIGYLPSFDPVPTWLVITEGVFLSLGGIVGAIVGRRKFLKHFIEFITRI